MSIYDKDKNIQKNIFRFDHVFFSRENGLLVIRRHFIISFRYLIGIEILFMFWTCATETSNGRICLTCFIATQVNRYGLFIRRKITVLFDLRIWSCHFQIAFIRIFNELNKIYLLPIIYLNNNVKKKQTFVFISNHTKKNWVWTFSV